MGRSKAWMGTFLCGAVILGASLGLAQVQDKGINMSPALRYKVVKLPMNIVEADYNTDGRPRKPGLHPVFPLDDLSAEGWELISVLRCEGGEFIAFLRKRK